MKKEIFYIAITFIVIAIILFIILSKNKEKFDKASNIIQASSLNTKNISYNNNVFIIRGNNYSVYKNSIKLFEKYPLKVSHILLGEEAPGFMRKITKITYTKEGGMELMTEKVDIDKVINNIYINKIFTPNDFLLSTNIPKNRQKEVELFNFSNDYKNFGRITENFEMSRTISIPIEEDIDIGEGNSLVLTGSLDITPELELELSANFSGISYFKYELRNNVEAIIQSTLDVKQRITKNWTTRIWPEENTYTWFVNIATGIWLILHPSIDGLLSLSVKGEFLSVSVLNLYTTVPYRAGIEYKKGNRLRKITGDGSWEKRLTTPTQEGSVSVTIRPGINFGLEARLWGFIGPLIILQLYYEYSYIIEMRKCKKITSILPKKDLVYPGLCKYSSDSKKIGVIVTIGGLFLEERIYFDILEFIWNL